MPKTSSKRPRRIADLIRQQLAILLKREVADPRLENVSITAVEMTPDLGTARIFYAVSGETSPRIFKEIDTAFSKGTGYMRRLLADATALRYVPKLVFIYDKSIAYGAELSSLINKVAPSGKEIDSDEEPNED
jgi:ribosome-binding factor A